MKEWYKSKTVWGGLIAVGAAAAGAFGIVVDEGAQDQLAEVMVLGATAVGGLVAVLGRVKATKKIGK